MNRGQLLAESADSWQQRRAVPSFLVALGMRYREDRGRQYGALLSYYGFISLFPLLLVLVTVLGIVLKDDPTRREQILDTVYDKIPVVGEQLRQDPASLNASGLMLVLGLLVSIWSGLAVIRVAQDALNLQWGVPRYRWPRFIARMFRAVAALVVVGVGILVATAVTNVAAFFPDLPIGSRALGAAFAIVLNIAVLTASFRILTQSQVSWRTLLPGGIAGGAALWALQIIGGTYVTRVIAGASDVYGAFASMFGLLVWIALLARVTLLASEINVVRNKRLWPRTLMPGRPTEADRRAYDESLRRAEPFSGTNVRLQPDDTIDHTDRRREK